VVDANRLELTQLPDASSAEPLMVVSTVSAMALSVSSAKSACSCSPTAGNVQPSPAYCT
jgi:hypothetical protein